MYVNYFSRALAHEIRGSGVTVQTLTPFYIATNLTRCSDYIGRPSLLVPNAQTFVRSALSTVGMCNNTTGYWSHEIQVRGFLLKNNQLFQIKKFLIKKMIMITVLRRCLVLSGCRRGFGCLLEGLYSNLSDETL